jgi:feruloyl esterase
MRLILVCASLALLNPAVCECQTSRPPEGLSPLQPKLACGDLRSLTGFEFTVVTAADVPAAAGIPEYCRVTGQVLPEIRFEVNLPATWNRRFYMTGNGGYAGESLDTPQRIRARAQPVQRGFATAATDTGHDASIEPLATFAVNRQKLFDYAFRSLHATSEAAKRLIAAYYGSGPARSYFEGCSTGGRQALILAQRFPEDFDGIIAGAPVLNFSGTMAGYACSVQALAAAPIPYAKLPLLADRIYAGCDAKDGLQDGLIDDPRRCDFRPSRDLTRCPEGTDRQDCFTPAQIGTLEKIYGDVVSRGRRIFPGWPVGAEIAGPNGRSGWDNWIVREAGGQTISASFAESFFRYMAFPEKDPKFDLSKFDLEKDPARLEWIGSVLDATDTDLRRYQGRGGKLLMYFGWADQALNAQMGADYYESVLARMGASTAGFFRLFMAPGMFHCSGGIGPNTFDMLTALLDWVERDAAPDRILASRMAGGKPVRTRPLCPYPQVARYSGAGSIDDAANFACRQP